MNNKFPRVIKLGKYEKPLPTKKFVKDLKEAKGIIFLIFKENDVAIVTHGFTEPRIVAETFGAMMEKTYGIKMKIILIPKQPKKVDYAS